jgi:membrane protease YdiL (CAAX protease family)
LNRRAGILTIVLVGITPLELNGLYNGYLSQFPAWYWLVETFTWILLPSLLLWMGMRSGWFSTDDIGLHTRICGRRNIWLFVVTLIGLSWLVAELSLWSNLLARAIFPVNYGKLDFEYTDVIPAGGLGRFLALTHLALTAGIVEELYFRGLVRLLFSNGAIGNLGFIVCSSVLFASIHWEGGVWVLTEALLFGLSTAVIYSITGNLWPLIIGHAWADYFWFS